MKTQKNKKDKAEVYYEKLCNETLELMKSRKSTIIRLG